MAWITARDGAMVREHLTNVGRRPARERVAHLLLELFHRLRRKAGDPAPLAEIAGFDAEAVLERAPS